MRQGGGVQESSHFPGDPAAPTLAARLTPLWRVSVQPGLSDAARIRTLLAMAQDALGAATAAFVRAAADGDIAAVTDASGAAGDAEALPGSRALWQRIAAGGAACEVRESGTGGAAQRVCGVPVHVAGALAGMLVFAWPDSGARPDADDRALMALAAEWLGNALYQSAQTARLEALALTDSLTGLPNRRAAEERLHQEVARAARRGEGFALALVDLDHFKLVNDRFGHAFGDTVLREVAQRLQSGLREGDWIARWGGEEFLFFLHDSDAQKAAQAMERLAERMRATPVASAFGPLRLTFSAGVSAIGHGGHDLAAALDGVDAALYQAKAGGRDRACVAPGARAVWSGQTLKEALAGGRLRMATQVIVDLQSGKPVADESLARVVAADGRVLEAQDFIDMAEGLGLMHEIDRQIVRLALARCIDRLDAGLSPEFAHFVNLSPQFLARRDLVEEMLGQAQAYCQSCGVALGPVKPIVLELTERQRIGNLDALRADLAPFIDFGFRLALDDFGSGYSSFVYLAQLPVSFLKIEGWLVANMRADRKVAGIVEGLAILAQKEGILTVAEHVEDAETARILREMGVNYGQGWLFGRPKLA
jgi:diguanylate cyclase (GGDEF)-like protein